MGRNNHNNIYKDKTIITFFILILIIIVTLFLTSFIKNKPNAQEPILFPNAYNTAEVTHPSLVNFNKRWHGYQYWLAFTPYEKGDSKMENPHVLASNNLVDWIQPKGLINPIDTPEGKIVKARYNSDTHLIIEKDKNRLQLFWRFVDRKKDSVIIYRSISLDGSNWSKKEIVLTSNFKNEALLSPAIILEDNIYKMWYVNKDGKIYFRSSKDCYNWSNREEIKVDFNDSKIKPWHLEVKKFNSDYEMLVVAFQMKGTKPIFKDRKRMSLYYSKSNDNKKWSSAREIIKPSKKPGHFDGKRLYRSSFIKEQENYVVFYSGFDYDKSAGIGIAYGEDITSLAGMTSKVKIIDMFSNNK